MPERDFKPTSWNIFSQKQKPYAHSFIFTTINSMKFLFTCILLFCVAEVCSQSSFTYPTLVVEYDSAIIFRNLKIIPVKRIEMGDDSAGTVNQKKYITLKQGMQRGLVTIKERGEYLLDNINILMIQNRSGKDLFIKSGEIVMGGRQDRVFAKDTIIPSSSKQVAVPVYCVEENRWSSHEKKIHLPR